MSEDKYNYLSIVRPGFTNRRPETDIEQELEDEKRRSKWVLIK